MLRNALLMLLTSTIAVGAVACGAGARDEAGADQPSDRSAPHQCTGPGETVFGGQCYQRAAPTQAAAAGGVYISYNPCPAYQPYQHCNIYGNCFCSAYP